MAFIKFNDSETLVQASVIPMSDTIVRIETETEPNLSGFVLYLDEEMLHPMSNDEYMGYTTLYNRYPGAYELSNDGSVWEEDEVTTYIPTITFLTMGGTIKGTIEQTVSNYEDLEIPTPEDSETYEFVEWVPEIPKSGEIKGDQTFTAIFEYIFTLQEVKNEKISEVTSAHNAVIQNGVDVQLSDGTAEHFALTDRDQTYLMGLQTQVLSGVEQIPWHPSDTSAQCKYYSNADMTIITTTAMQFVTYHVTYLRALTIYINSLQTKEEVTAITYGSEIPEEHVSEPLKDMMLAMTNA